MRTMLRRLLPAITGAALLAAPGAAQASTSPSEAKASAEHGATYIRSAQQSDGSFSGFGAEWALSALAAEGTAPAGVKSGTTDARSWYRDLVGDAATWPGGASPPVTDYENAALAAYSAGIDPARVSTSQDLIAHILGGWDPATPGYYGEPGFFNGTIFAVLALTETRTRKGEERVPATLLAPSIAAIRANQHTDGGWTFFKAAGNPEALEAPGEAELTGAAIAALCSAGVPSSDPAIVAAQGFLAGDLEGDGAFGAEFGPNTDTNAWAVQGLDTCGIDPQGAQFTSPQGHTPLDYLLSQQLAGGGFQFETGSGEANLYSTQDGVRALSGAGFSAEPAKAKGAPKLVFEKAFAPGQATVVGLILNSGGAVSACSVAITPSAAKTTLGAVLEAAQSAAQPSGCVSAFTTGKGGAIASVNGHTGSWTLSADGGTAKAAKTKSAVHVGDTLYLNG